MGLEGTSLWDTVERVALDEGVELFDLDLPADTRRGGVLRVFITRSASAEVDQAKTVDHSESSEPKRVGISFEDCVRVSKRLLDLDEQSEIIPANCTLEVSSPGINRKLRLPAHFKGAVGERVKVKFRDQASGTTKVVNGVVRGVEADRVQFEAESDKEVYTVPVGDIKEARVDFKF